MAASGGLEDNPISHLSDEEQEGEPALMLAVVSVVEEETAGAGRAQWEQRPTQPEETQQALRRRQG